MYYRLLSIVLAAILLAGCNNGANNSNTNQPAAKTEAGAEVKESATHKVMMKTTAGDIVLELDAVKAPITVKNFLRYVDEKFYDGLIFHRVIADFMIQGGGFDEDFNKRPTHAAIKNEAANGLRNVRGSIAMARTAVVDSATAQFFINVKDNRMLDHKVRDYGYAVFGKVVKGMNVVDKIRYSATHSVHGMANVPIATAKIISVRRLP